MNWAIELAKIYESSDHKSNLFGVLIYTDAHAYIKKVLYDDVYWRALDEISGPKWEVFATRAAQGTYEFPQLPPGHMGMMRLVWKEPKANKELLEAFEIDSTNNLPVVVVFALDHDGEVYKNVIKIDDSSEEQAYKSIKSVLTMVTNALDMVTEENLRNGANAFHAVSYSIKNYKEWQKIKKGISIIDKLKSWVKIIS